MASCDLTRLFSEANCQIDQVCKWFQSNRLTLNVKKTKFIIFVPPDRKETCQEKIYINGQEIERIGESFAEKSFKFVGFHIDEKLSWDYHLQYLSRSLAVANYTIASSKQLLPLSMRKSLYNSFFRSRLECNLRCLRAHGEAFDERCLCRCWRFGEREITFGSRCGHELGLDGFLLHLFRWGGRSNSQAN